MLRCDCPTEIDEARVRAYLPQCSPRDALLIELGFETGLRTTELLRLTIADVWRNGAPVTVLRVPRRMLKGGGVGAMRARSVNSRAIPLNDLAQDALHRALSTRVQSAPPDLLFPGKAPGRPLTRQQVANIVRATFRRAGLDPNRVWAGHSLRQRFAQRIYAQTRDIELVRVALSHRWVTTTQAYIRAGDNDAANAILAIGRVQEGDEAASIRKEAVS